MADDWRDKKLWNLDDEELEYLQDKEARQKADAEQLNDSEDELERAEDSDAEESDDEGGSRAQRRKTKRDGELFANAKLKNQGIRADEGAGQEDEEETPEEARRRRVHALDHIFRKEEDMLPMESFSMKDYRENASGYLRDTGEKEEVTDAWLDSVDQKGKKDGGEDDLKMEASEEPERGQEGKAPSQADSVGRLVGLLKDGETVLDALRRLGSAPSNSKNPQQQKKPQGFKKNVRKKYLPAAEEGAEAGPAESEEEKRARKQQFDLVTDLSANLMKLGHANVYGQKREQLARTYEALQQELRREAERKRQFEIARSMPIWEYKWAPEDEEIHGPFPGDKMNEWREHFDTAVVRRVFPGKADLVQAWRPASEVPDFKREHLDGNDAAAGEDEDEDMFAPSSSSSTPSSASSSSSSSSSSSGSASSSGYKRSAAAVSEAPEDGEEDIFAMEPASKKPRQ